MTTQITLHNGSTLHATIRAMIEGAKRAAKDSKFEDGKDLTIVKILATVLIVNEGRAVKQTPVTLELEPVGDSFWPGGSYDKGERPRGEILNLTMSDKSGHTLLSIENVGVTFQALAKAKTAIDAEKLLFGGDDGFSITRPNMVVNSWNGRDEITFSEGAGSAHGGNGNDVINGDYTITTGMNRFYGDAGNDVLNGSDNGTDNPSGGRDRLDGGSGNDRLYGNYGRDILIGGTGNDRIEGGRDADVLTGGAGKDTFHFAFGYPLDLDNMDSGLETADRDRITDFKRGEDKISVTGGSTDLEFIGKAAFTAESGSNQARYVTTRDGVTVYFDVNQDGVADWAINIDHVRQLAASDFLFG